MSGEGYSAEKGLRTKSTQWAVRFDDGEVQQMRSRKDAEDYIASVRADITAGHYDADDYAGMCIVKRKRVEKVTPWRVIPLEETAR